MTLEQNNTVRLSARDWAGIVGVVLTLLVVLGNAYLAHDRLLTQLVTQQTVMNQRLDKIENRLEAATPHPAAH